MKKMRKVCAFCGLDRSIPMYAEGKCPRCDDRGLMKWEQVPGHNATMTWPNGTTAHWMPEEFGDDLCINVNLPDGGHLCVCLPFRTEEELNTFKASLPTGIALPFGGVTEMET